MAKLREAVASGDREAITRNAHSLRGGCGPLVGEFVSSVTREIEQLAGDGALDQLPGLVDSVDAALAEATTETETRLGLSTSEASGSSDAGPSAPPLR